MPRRRTDSQGRTAKGLVSCFSSSFSSNKKTDLGSSVEYGQPIFFLHPPNVIPSIGSQFTFSADNASAIVSTLPKVECEMCQMESTSAASQQGSHQGVLITLRNPVYVYNQYDKPIEVLIHKDHKFIKQVYPAGARLTCNFHFNLGFSTTNSIDMPLSTREKNVLIDSSGTTFMISNKKEEENKESDKMYQCETSNVRIVESAHANHRALIGSIHVKGKNNVGVVHGSVVIM